MTEDLEFPRPIGSLDTNAPVMKSGKSEVTWEARSPLTSDRDLPVDAGVIDRDVIKPLRLFLIVESLVWVWSVVGVAIDSGMVLWMIRPRFVLEDLLSPAADALLLLRPPILLDPPF